MGQRQNQGLCALVLGRRPQFTPAGAPRFTERLSSGVLWISSIRPPRRYCSRYRPGSARYPSTRSCRVMNAVAWWMTAQLSNAMAGSRPNSQPMAVRAARLCYRDIRVRRLRSRATESHSAFHDADRLLAAAGSSAPGWQEACSHWRPRSRFSRSRCFPGWFGAGSGNRGQHDCPSRLSVYPPAPVRGFQHNAHELKTWYQGMVGSSSEKGFGQRDEQNWSWVNQSIIAVTHRLTRPVNYTQEIRPGRRAR